MGASSTNVGNKTNSDQIGGTTQTPSNNMAAPMQIETNSNFREKSNQETDDQGNTVYTEILTPHNNSDFNVRKSSKHPESDPCDSPHSDDDVFDEYQSDQNSVLEPHKEE